MNKQLRQFEKESGLDIYGLGKDRTKWEQALEKFAELIVRECSNFLKDTLDDHFAAEQIQEHFGVEE